MDYIRQMEIEPGMDADELVRMMENCGFGARRLAEAVNIYQEMLSGDYTKFFTLAGAMVPAGMRNIVSGLIRDGKIDVLISTGANLVHDVIEAYSHHVLGDAEASDSRLRDEGVSRIYDVYVGDDDFIRFEELLQQLLPESRDPMAGTELLRHLGSRIDDEKSILRAASDCGVPIFCPAISDSMIGLQAWLYKQTNKLNLDAFSDVGELVEICYAAERSGIVIIGGGVPKNFALQSMLVTPKSFELAIQLTTDRPEPGGLSGASLSEAVSWGKIAPEARKVTVYGDATINFPLMVASALTRLERA
ncbi:deoxyhypusine synthase [Methanocrinis sp.]|uniref:deoxyhypusine synthase n=1 Tax=Methanocrinis sp. TaxID=3101522 RepID=UPI003D12416E